MNTNQTLLDRERDRLSWRGRDDQPDGQLDGLSKRTLRALVRSLALAKDPAKPDVVIAAALSEVERR